MNIVFASHFRRFIKKFHRNQIPVIEDGIEVIQQNPTIGEMKRADLAGVRVYKFKLFDQLALLAYLYYEQKQEIVLLACGSHENFYRDLKKIIN